MPKNLSAENDLKWKIGESNFHKKDQEENNSAEIVLAITLAVRVLATPGTPSSRMWPPVKIPTKRRSTISYCPMIT